MTVRAASSRQRRDRADEGEIVADNIVFWEAWMMAGEVRVRGCDGMAARLESCKDGVVRSEICGDGMVIRQQRQCEQFLCEQFFHQ